MMAIINFISFNCNGLSNINKVNCIFALCVERKYDIVCLQETFWNNDFIEKFERDQTIWEGENFYSNGDNNRQGVAISISKKFKNVFF
jgi:exonuclease III